MRSRLMRVLLRVAPLLLVLAVAGCGEVDWFPEYVRQSTTPDAFSFEAKSGTEKNVSVTSGEIEVTGLTAESSPISISGASGSKYSINGATATSSAGTVKNGDKVTVSHTSSTSLGTATTSTLTIGDVSADFVSTTRTFELTFTTATTVGEFRQSYADVQDVGTSHKISIKDSRNSGSAVFAVTDKTVVNPDSATTFSGAEQTFGSLNGKRIFVRNLATVVDVPATTTLTIDGVETVVSLQLP